MSPAERATLQRLWLQAETRGLDALTAAERAEFRALMGRLEQLLHTPLKDKGAKNALRAWARKDYFLKHNAKLAKELGEAVEDYEVHHALPLEYAHLFPKLNLNGKANLIGMHADVHKSVNRIWAAARKTPHPLSANDVSDIAGIINKHLGQWLHTIYEPAKTTSALAKAEQAALKAVQHLLNR
jgi:hypothetical protein